MRTVLSAECFDSVDRDLWVFLCVLTLRDIVDVAVAICFFVVGMGLMASMILLDGAGTCSGAPWLGERTPLFDMQCFASCSVTA
jgi:hypothetical protein